MERWEKNTYGWADNQDPKHPTQFELFIKEVYFVIVLLW
jgi:hypothetical protein